MSSCDAAHEKHSTQKPSDPLRVPGYLFLIKQHATGHHVAIFNVGSFLMFSFPQPANGQFSSVPEVLTHVSDTGSLGPCLLAFLLPPRTDMAKARKVSMTVFLRREARDKKEISLYQVSRAQCSRACVLTHVCVCMCVVYVWIVCLCTCVHVCLYVCVHICMCVHMCANVFICVLYTCAHLCVFVCVDTCGGQTRDGH